MTGSFSFSFSWPAPPSFPSAGFAGGAATVGLGAGAAAGFAPLGVTQIQVGLRHPFFRYRFWHVWQCPHRLTFFWGFPALRL